MISSEDVIRSKIREHIQSFWPNSRLFEKRWPVGPLEHNLPGFRVLRLESRTPDRPHVYVTSGCFSTEPAEHLRHEFFLLSIDHNDRHVETLAMVANFHADERYRLDVGRTIAIGGPWIEHSGCDHLLVSLPYPYGPRLERLQLSDMCVRFLWLMPITAREAAFAELNGAEALEQKFDLAKTNYLDARRASVV